MFFMYFKHKFLLLIYTTDYYSIDILQKVRYIPVSMEVQIYFGLLEAAKSIKPMDITLFL